MHKYKAYTMQHDYRPLFAYDTNKMIPLTLHSAPR